MLSIILSEIQNALKRGSRVELRNVFTLETRLQKEGFRRNPKTGEKIFVNQKKNISGTEPTVIVGINLRELKLFFINE